MIYHNADFFRYINDIIVFNCDNFENISLSIYSKELIGKKNISSTNFTSFLNLKINLVTNIWIISTYDKKIRFKF